MPLTEGYSDGRMNRTEELFFGKEIARKALEDIEVCPVALSGKPSGYYV